MNVNEAVRKTLNGVLIDVEVVPGADKKGLFFDGWRKRIKIKVKGRASRKLFQRNQRKVFECMRRKKCFTLFPSILGICGSKFRKMESCTFHTIKNEANNDVLGFFSKLFDRKVKIFSGEHSRKKTVFIENINPDDAVRKIGEMMK